VIHVDRNSIKKPSFFSSRQYAELNDHLSEQMARDAKQKKQARFKFDFTLVRKALAVSLLNLFSKKCAYCEDVIDDQSFVVDHFRPVSLYPWLAYEWSNLYPVCRACSRNKGHQFPLAKGSKPARSPADISDEKPLLLDPCNSRPEKHLFYADQGLMQSNSDPGEDLGGSTINVLGLNRSALQNKRSKLGQIILDKLDKTTSSQESGNFNVRVAFSLEKAVRSDSPFAGMCRQLLAAHLLKNPKFAESFKVKYPTIKVVLKDATQAQKQRESKVIKVSKVKKASRKKPAIKKTGMPASREPGIKKSRKAGAGVIRPQEIGSPPPGKTQPGTARSKASAPRAPRALEASQTRAPQPKASKPKRPQAKASRPKAPARKASPAKASRPGALAFNRSQQLNSEVDSLPITNAAIQSIHITNFKAIHDLHLNPALSPEEPILEHAEDEATLSDISGWMTLLGENGSGKSSVLQAVALALAGKELLQQTGLNPQGFLMRGKRSAKVELELTNGSPIVLKVTKTKFTFESGAKPHGVFVRAYGSTRLLPVEKPEGEAVGKTSRVQFLNMFDPFQPLIDADRWLAGLSETDFQPARLAIKDLLGLGENQELEKKGEEILVDGQPLSNLSAGYQTIIALACDIMAGVPHVLDDMQQAQGIVLIDEIGSHLHPQWKMRIVPRLRKAFPLIQFLVSSHDPLCLRGHSSGEVLLVTRAPNPELTARQQKTAPRLVSVDGDLPSPRNLRVDQLLTSRHFGMDSTIDPRIDDKFSEYYQLLALKHELKPDQIQRCDRLAAELKQYGVLGYTRRDQLVYEAIDEYLALEPSFRMQNDDDAARKARRSQVKKRIGELWRYANAFDPENGT